MFGECSPRPVLCQTGIDQWARQSERTSRGEASDPPFLTGVDPYNWSAILRLFSTMNADPAAVNHIDRLEHTSPNELETQLPLLFEKIVDPDQEPRLVYSYVVSTYP